VEGFEIWADAAISRSRSRGCHPR